jgi:hypothetical protein
MTRTSHTRRAVFVIFLTIAAFFCDSRQGFGGDAAAFASVETCPRDGNPAVRGDDAYTRGLIDYGVEHSASFAALVQALEDTDMIVIVEADHRLSMTLNGYLVYMSTTTACRYVRVRFTTRVSRVRAVPIIGHELQHALEVGRHPEVTDAETMRAMYERIGQRSTGDNAFESAEAERMGRVISLELFRPAPAIATDADR